MKNKIRLSLVAARYLLKPDYHLMNQLNIAVNQNIRKGKV